MTYEFLTKMYRIFNKDILQRLESINNIIFYIVLIKFRDNYNIQSDDINIIKEELTKKNLFNFNLDVSTTSINQFTSNDIDIPLTDLINSVYLYYLKNDTQLNIREYDKYYNNALLTQYIVNMCKPSIKDKIFDGNMKINSYLDYSIKYMQSNTSDSIELNNLYGSCENDTVRSMLNNMLYINSKKSTNFNKNLLSSNIMINDIMIHGTEQGMFDVIYFDCTSSKHNIIHASCCSRIKEFKIRGTNYESLIIQLIMKSLNKNGNSVIIIPDSFLYSESNQIVETRKYLINNFNILKIIHMNDNIFYTKGNKYSLIYLENTKQTQNIHLMSILVDNNSIKESHINSINYDLIKANNYALYSKLYNEKASNKQLVKFNEINILDCIDIYTNISVVPLNTGDVLVIDKYYNGNSSFRLTTSDKVNSNYNLILVEKNNDKFLPKFTLFYLEYLLKNKTQSYLTGKLNLIDRSKVSTIKIPLVPHATQSMINSYYISTNKIYNYNVDQIKSYSELKNNLFTLLDNTNIVSLDKVIDINTTITLMERYSNKTLPLVVSVQKNSMQAGSVILLENVIVNANLSNNVYYLVAKDNDVLTQYIYNYLCYIENKIKELAQLTLKPNLSISQLNNIKVPMVEEELQRNIVQYNKSFDNTISKIRLDCDSIKDKDIMNIITQLYNFT